MAADKEPPDYTVGYGRPPVATRFEKGRSGNPKGRPKLSPMQPLDLAAEPSKAALHKAISRPVRVRRGDKIEEVPAIEAMAEALLNKAIGGSRLHIRMVQEQVREQEAEKRRERIQIHDYWQKHMRENQRLLDEAKAAGRPPPRVLPHPLDIVFGEPFEAVRLLGPPDEATFALYEPDIVRRDHHLERAAYYRLAWWHGLRAHRRGRKPPFCIGLHGIVDDASFVSGALLMAFIYDQTLPPSLRLGKWPCVEAYHRYLEQPLAELRARVVTHYNREIRARSQPMVTDLADEGWMRWDALCLALEGKKKEESMKEMLAQLSPPLRAFFEAELERASSGELPWDLRRKAG